jgi:hypothetical protein
MNEGIVMNTFAPALAVAAALMWPVAASGQSLAEVAQREAARRAAEANANASKPPSASAGLPARTDSQAVTQEPAAGGAISLAEVARREAERRKAVAAAGRRGKTLTTSDVKKWEPPQETTADQSPEAGSGEANASGGKGDTAKATDAQKPSPEATKGEAYWHGRMTAAREELRRNEAFAEALQSRINALSAEFSAKDDPNQRALVADDRQKALAELDRLTQDIDTNKKSITDLEEEARRAGVPAGWIR